MHCKRRSRQMVIGLLLLGGVFLGRVPCEGAEYLHPRVGTFVWGRQFADNFQHYTDFDFLVLSVERIQGIGSGTYDWADSVEALKARNDSLVVLGYVGLLHECSNWAGYYHANDAWFDSLEAHAEEWWLYDTDGDYWRWPPSTDCTEGMLNWTRADMAKVCAKYIYDSVFARSPMIWDGFHIDYVMETASWLNAHCTGGLDSVDSDRDSIPDDPQALDSAWAAGVDTFCHYLRMYLGDSVVVVNTAQVPSSCYQYLNGTWHENFMDEGTRSWLEWMQDPSIGYLGGDTLFSDEPMQFHGLAPDVYWWSGRNYDPDTLGTFTQPHESPGLDSMVEKTIASALLGDGGYYCLLGYGPSWQGTPQDTVLEPRTTAYWLDQYDELRGKVGVPEASWDSATVGGNLYFTRVYSGGVAAIKVSGSGDCSWAKVDVVPEAEQLSVGGSTFVPGDSMAITWQATDVREDSSTFRVSLYLSRNGGVTYGETIVENTLNDGSFQWVVRDSLSASCRIRAVVLDTLLLKGKPDPEGTATHVDSLFAYDTTTTFAIFGCGSAGQSLVNVGVDSLMMCPSGDGDTLVVTVTVNDSNAYPIPGLPGDSVYVVLDCDSNNINFCSNDTLYPEGWTNGAGEIAVREAHVGGCGKIYLRAYLCGTVCGYDTVWVNSPDITGNGLVNFQDTNKFLQMKGSGQGWCGDFDHDGDVDSDDQGIYTPHVVGSHQCPTGGKCLLAGETFADGSGVYRIVATSSEVPGSARRMEISYGLTGGPARACELRLAAVDQGTRLVTWTGGPDTDRDRLAFVDPSGGSAVLAEVNLLGVVEGQAILLGAIVAEALTSGDPAISVSAVVEAPDGAYYAVGATEVEPERPSHETSVPGAVFVEANQPNPFNPTTAIRFGVPRTAEVSVVVLDLAGREVRTLLHEVRPAGVYEAVWDGRGNDGSLASSGLYFCRLVAGDTVLTQKMLLVR